MALPHTVDVCVVGAGVAGAATALRLARHGVGVALIDAGVERRCDAGVDRRHESRRLRVSDAPSELVTREGRGAARTASHTAEVLPPSAVHALAALGVDDARALGSACRGVLSRWHGDDPGFTDFELFGCTPGRAVNRGAVAGCLAAHAVRAGAEVATVGAIRGERSRSGWALHSERHAQRGHIVCRHLIDATGRSGRAIAGLPARHYDDRAVCLSTRHATPLDDPEVLLVDRSTHGWWYAVAAGEGLTDVAFVTDADLLPPARARAAWLATEYREATLVRAHLVGCPSFATLTNRDARSGHRATAAGDGWLAVGDAALSWDPLSGHGMQFALESAARAAIAVVDGDAVRRYSGYARWYGDAVADYERARTDMYAAAAPSPPHVEFWRRRCGCGSPSC